jgi:L-asparagine oxygenase
MDRLMAESTLWELPVDYRFSAADHDALHALLMGITVNPYRFYEVFRRQVRHLVASGQLPASFVDFASGLRVRDRTARPFVTMRNVPVDKDIPIFDYDEPVKSKYDLKTTFVAEGFLETLATLSGAPAIGYLFINQGDVFQDVHPKRALAATQSQKGLGELFFHQDMANHVVRPDIVYMLGMRGSPENDVYTAFVSNSDVIADLTGEERALLREPLYFTPFDRATAKDGETPEPQRRPILLDDGQVRFVETRTAGATSEAQALVEKFTKLVHQHRRRVHFGAGDFVGLYNGHGLHAREHGTIRDQEALRTRWLLKTTNVDDLDPHRTQLVPGSDYLVNG